MYKGKAWSLICNTMLNLTCILQHNSHRILSLSKDWKFWRSYGPYVWRHKVRKSDAFPTPSSFVYIGINNLLLIKVGYATLKFTKRDTLNFNEAAPILGYLTAKCCLPSCLVCCPAGVCPMPRSVPTRNADKTVKKDLGFAFWCWPRTSRSRWRVLRTACCSLQNCICGQKSKCKSNFLKTR